MQKIILPILILLFLSSCDLFRKVEREETVYDDEEEIGELTGQVIYNEETGRYETIKEPIGTMDTLRWTVADEERFPPITSTVVDTGTGTGEPGDVPPTGQDDPRTEYKDRYAITYALPFVNRMNSGGSIYENSKWALNFYAGSKIALRELQQEGMSLDVRVLDTEADANEMRNLIATDRQLRNSDLIIGPYLRDNARSLAEFGKQNQKMVVSPYTASANVATENPFYVQVNPGLPSHLNTIVRHVKGRYDDDQIVILVPDLDEERRLLNYMQQVNQEVEGRDDVPALQEIRIDAEDLSMEGLDLSTVLQPDKKNVFIVPVYRSENFVVALLRKLKIAARGQMEQQYEIEVYGLPQWRDYQKVDLQDYEDLNVHVSGTDYINRSEAEVYDFRQAYYNETGALPDNSAYQGYDITRYFGTMLRDHGTRFAPWLEREPKDMLHTQFRFERHLKPGTAGAESDVEPPVQFWENKFIYILEFEDFEFQPVR